MGAGVSHRRTGLRPHVSKQKDHLTCSHLNERTAEFCSASTRQHSACARRQKLLVPTASFSLPLPSVGRQTFFEANPNKRCHHYHHMLHGHDRVSCCWDCTEGSNKCSTRTMWWL